MLLNMCAVIIFSYFYIAKYIPFLLKRMIKNELDTFLKELEVPTEDNKYRTKLHCIVASGDSKSFLGKSYSLKDIDDMTDTEVERQFMIYQAAYCGRISDNLIETFLSCVSKAASYLIPIDNSKQLNTDLHSDYIITSELKNITGMIAYTLGPYLALVNTGLIIGQHVEINKKTPTKPETQVIQVT